MGLGTRRPRVKKVEKPGGFNVGGGARRRLGRRRRRPTMCRQLLGRGCCLGVGDGDGGRRRRCSGLVVRSGKGAEGDACNLMWERRGKDPLQDCNDSGEFGEKKSGERLRTLEVESRR
jgi:hypothetical protein